MSKLAVVFPGIGYTADKPLLYYSRKIAAECGYDDIRVIAYTGFPAKILGDREKMTESYRIALKQSGEMLADTDFSSYDEVLFISSGSADRRRDFAAGPIASLYTAGGDFFVPDQRGSCFYRHG